MEPAPTDLRPLAHAPSYPRDEGVGFLLDGREVAIDGDVEFVARVLALCDGRLSVAEIAARLGDSGDDARALIGALHELGVLLDCSEAWRRFDAISSARSGLYRPVSADVLEQIGGVSSRPDREPVRTVSIQPAPTRLGEIVAERRSAVAGEPPRPISFGELSTVLFAMYGRRDDGRRPVPSGGGLYPLLVHVWLRAELVPLQAGIWWYDPRAGALGLLAAPAPDTYDVFVRDNACADLLARDGPVVFLSADVGRSSRKYSNRAYRFALIEVGAAMQNAYLACSELGVPIRAAAGFDEPAAADALLLADGSVALLTLLLGS